MIIKTLVKTTILGVGILGGIYVGDKYQPITKAQDFFKYTGIVAQNGTPKDFFNYNTKIEINDNKATLYFGNKVTNEYKKVNEDGTVGSLGESIDNFFQKTKNYINTNSSSIYDKSKRELETFIQNIKQ